MPYARLLATLSLLSAMAIGSTAAAMPADTDDVKTKADASFDCRDYGAALAGYREALAKRGDPRLYYNIAQTLTALERFPEALASYQTFISEAPPGTLNAAQQEKFFTLLDELKAKIARVEVKCSVAGARVLVRDQVVGTVPLAGPVSVNAGPAKVEVIADGYKPFVTNVNLPGGRPTTVEPALERVDFTGALSVTSSVAGTHVLVDGADHGVAPLTLKVERGAHVVSARATGYVETSETVTVEAGQRPTMSFSPFPAPDYTLAYVGVGVGIAGIATGTVTGILALDTFSTAKGECDVSTKVCGPAGQSDLQSSKTYGALSTAAFVVGAAGVGLGAYGWIRARARHHAEKPVQVIALPGGVRLAGEF